MASRKSAKKSGKTPPKRPVGKQSARKQIRKASKRKASPIRKPVKKARPARRPLRKVTTVKARPVAKAVKTDIKKLKKASKKAVKKSTSHDRQLALLRKELEELKRKKRTASLSDYNRFMRQQIKSGKSFKEAAKAWQKRKRELAKKNKKRTAYNIFISMQLKQGKTMKQAISAWNDLKKPKRARVVRSKSVALKRQARKKPAKRPARKPARKAKPKKQRPAKKVKARKPAKKAKAKKPAKRPKKSARKPGKPVSPQIRVAKIVDGVISGITKGQEKRLEAVKKLASSTKLPSMQEGLSQEEIALKMLDVYFTEVARYGLKRKLSLDEVINAYFYALLRVQRKQIEVEEIKKAAKRD